MRTAIDAARAFKGQTAPNPPVGAVITNRFGSVISVAAHERAGSPHAEANAINHLKEIGRLPEAHSLYVTLEPCGHEGKTPPCTRAILDSPIQNIYIGALDPNPLAKGGGDLLRSAGRNVVEVLGFRDDCVKLIEPFRKWILTGIPFVILKTAHRADKLVGLTLESMMPPAGEKTFTSQDSLRKVHLLRRESDAIFTSLSTVMVDNPLFTVRLVDDFPGKERTLTIFSRSAFSRPFCDPIPYLKEAEKRGFQTRMATSIDDELKFLGQKGVHQVLVEAGPAFSNAILESGCWDLHIEIIAGKNGMVDEIRERRRVELS